MPQRIPLFAVSLAFACGCVSGLAEWVTQIQALFFLCLSLALWLGLLIYCRSRPNLTLGIFLLCVALFGLAHTRIQLETIPANDLRLLPAQKSDISTQWRGIVLQADRPAPKSTRRRLQITHANVLVQIIAWRSGEGLPFTHELNTPWYTASGTLQATFLDPIHALKVGDRISFAAGLKDFPIAASPGQLDSQVYNARQNMYYRAEIAPLAWHLDGSGWGEAWRTFSVAARDWAYDRLRLGLEDDPETSDVLAGMLIGYREEMSREIEDDFRNTGTLHIFAVSGQNVAELALLGILFIQICGLVQWRWGWLMAPVVVAYCLLTGSQASAIRATLMSLSLLLAWKLERPISVLGLWSITFLGLMFWNPLILLDVGAQLSFAVVLALILMASPLARWLRTPFRADPFLPRRLWTKWQEREDQFWRWLLGLFAASLAATLVSEPITAIQFHQITPVSIFANLIVVPIAGLITTIGTLSICFSVTGDFLPSLFNNANWLLARVLIWFVGIMAHSPGAAYHLPDLKTWSLTKDPAPLITILPLEDGAALLLQTQGKVWLFNTGREQEARYITRRALEYYGINRLDGLVLTQISTPDNGGATSIIPAYIPRRIILPVLSTRSPLQRQLNHVLTTNGQIPEYWQGGYREEIAPGFYAEVLAPSKDSDSPRAEDRALVVRLHDSTHSLLWAGKIGAGERSQITSTANLVILANAPGPLLSEINWLHQLEAQDWIHFHRTKFALPLDDTDLKAKLTGIRYWPLEQTGALEIRWQENSLLTLKPWVSQYQPSH